MVRVVVLGTPIECETAGEAMALIKAVENTVVVRNKRKRVEPRPNQNTENRPVAKDSTS